MAKESVVVVGAGKISGVWSKAIQEEGLSVPAVVDVDVEAAEKLAGVFGDDCRATDDLKDALAKGKCDFVLDLSVPETHCEVTCTALEAGCHVLGEKPMAPNLEQARKMIETAQRTGLIYMVSLQRRWVDEVVTVKRVIESGVLGSIGEIVCDYHMGLVFDGFRAEMASPLILDMAIHHFDMARFFSEQKALRVYAKEWNPKGSTFKGDASACCIFDMSDDVVFTYMGTWAAMGCDTKYSADWRISGEKGTLMCRMDEVPRVELFELDAKGEGEYIEHEVEPVKLGHISGWHGSLRHMLESIRTGREPDTVCHESFNSLSMVFGAMESSRKSAQVPIQLLGSGGDGAVRMEA